MNESRLTTIQSVACLVCCTLLGCSSTTAGQGQTLSSDNTPLVDTSGGGPTEPVGGEDPPPDVVSGAVNDRVCNRFVPQEVLPSIDCTPRVVGEGYDACSEANTACGSVIGCVVERNEAID